MKKALNISGQGSTQEFNRAWEKKRRTARNYWRKGFPRNQIELAFKMHWTVFEKYVDKDTIQTCLEVGCGRGSISSFFAEHGCRCFLLDSSLDALRIAKNVFENNNHKGYFICGDANNLPFKDNVVNAVISIGLLEHFSSIKRPLSEEVRVLTCGGDLLAYIVPEKRIPVQRLFSFINRVLHVLWRMISSRDKKEKKIPLYRNDYQSNVYDEASQDLPLTFRYSTGMYPLPMISHSPDFPFSLMHPVCERILVFVFMCVLSLRKILMRRNPWLCREKYGQAFLFMARKGKER